MSSEFNSVKFSPLLPFSQDGMWLSWDCDGMGSRWPLVLCWSLDCKGLGWPLGVGSWPWCWPTAHSPFLPLDVTAGFLAVIHSSAFAAWTMLPRILRATLVLSTWDSHSGLRQDGVSPDSFWPWAHSTPVVSPSGKLSSWISRNSSFLTVMWKLSGPFSPCNSWMNPGRANPNSPSPWTLK